MSQEIVVALITVVGTVIGTVVGSLIVTVKPNQKWVALVVIMAGGVSGFLLGILLSQPSVLAGRNPSSFQESFDNPAYNDQYDTSIWYCNNCDFQERKALQQGEVLRFEASSIGASNSLELRSRSTWPEDKIISFEGRMKFDENSESGGVWLAVGGANCFLRVADNSSRRLVFQCGYVKPAEANRPEEWQYSTDEIPADFGAWYNVRIDFHPTNSGLSFYLDRSLIGQYVPGNPESNVEIRMGSWTDTTNTVTYVDEIILITE